MPSFGGEVNPSVPCRRFAACKRSLHLPWKSQTVGKIGSAISRPYFPPSLIEVSHVAGRAAPLQMTGETKSGAQRARSYGLGASGLQGPGSAPTILYSSTHSLTHQTSAQLKKEWSYTSAPPIRLHAVDRYNFIFNFTAPRQILCSSNLSIMGTERSSVHDRIWLGHNVNLSGMDPI
jgi:hypothetical protein